MPNATSIVVKYNHLSLEFDAVFKKQRASNVPIHLQDRVNRLLDILEHYEIISLVEKKRTTKNSNFYRPVIILAKEESL